MLMFIAGNFTTNLPSSAYSADQVGVAPCRLPETINKHGFLRVI